MATLARAVLCGRLELSGVGSDDRVIRFCFSAEGVERRFQATK